MKAMKSFKTAVLGLSALMLIAGVACGKKKSGGGVVATPPAADQNCVDSSCNAGQQYASGIFLATAVGQNTYGYNKNMTVKMSFFGKDSAGFDSNSLNNGSIVIYRGAVVATGTVQVRDGQYYGLSKPMTERMVSNFGFSIDLGYSLGGGFNYGYNFGGGNNNYGGGSQQPYYDYYYQPTYPNYPTYPCTQQYPNNCGNNGNNGGGYTNACELPTGDYVIETTGQGQWQTTGGYGASFSNLNIRIKGSNKTAEAVIQGYVNKGHSVNTLSAQLIIKSVNGQSCNTQVVF